jgi:hypothetical protein
MVKSCWLLTNITRIVKILGHIKPNIEVAFMFCWPCIIIYQYSETNVMHFLFTLLRINGLYMFRALLAHPQESLNKRNFVCCVCVMSVGCTRIGVEVRCTSGTSYIACVLCQLAAPGLEYSYSFTQILVQPTDITSTQYTKYRLCSASWEWASNVRNM